MTKRFPLLFVLIAFATMIPLALSAEEVPAKPVTPLDKYNVPIDLGPTGDTMSLSLEQAIRIAIKNNLGVETYRYGLRSAIESQAVEEAAFDSILFADIPLVREKTMSTTGTGNVFTSEVGYTLGIKRRIKTGTYFQLQFTDDFTDYNVPAPESRATLMFTVAQPLLRNFGRAFNTAPLEIASNNKEIARKQIEDAVNTLIYDITNAYWNLALSRDRLAVAQQGMNLAIELYRTTENFVRSGAERNLSLLRAEAGVAAREEAVLLARLGVKASEDVLKMLLNLNGDGSIPDTVLQLVDAPAKTEVPCSFDDSITYALTRRPDLMQMRIGLANAKLGMDISRNQLKPKFDLAATFALTGLSGDYGENFEGMVRGDYYTFSFGFNIEYPLGNRAAEASLRKAQADFSQLKTSVIAAEQGVVMQVRNAVRTVRTNFRRINSAVIARQLAERSLSEEVERYGVGRSTATEVLRFQTELIAAQNTELQAIIDYNVSIAALNKACAASLSNYRLDPPSLEAPSMTLPEWEGETPDVPLSTPAQK